MRKHFFRGDHPTSRISRRELLAGVAAAGTAALFPAGLSLAQTRGGPAGRLDFHNHFASPQWARKMADVKWQGWDSFQDYSPRKAFEAIDAAGVQTAFISSTHPGVAYTGEFRIDPAEAISLARDMNEFGARMAADYKGRFGLFAVLPLPDVDACLKEIEYAMDVLKAAGMGLLTSYGDVWLGDRRIEPVMDELNRRKAVVFVHPSIPACCRTLAGGVFSGTVEWTTDTARTINSLLARRPGTPASVPDDLAVPATRYSDITFIWSHAGGTLVGAAPRVVRTLSEADLSGTPPVNSTLHHVRRFYYDTAGSANPLTMQALKKLLGGTSHIVFGSDYPAGTPAHSAELLHSAGFTAAELAGIERENGLAVLPAYRR